MGKLSMPFRNSQSTSLSSWYETQQMGCRCNHCPKTYTLASSKHLVGICRARCLADKPERYKRNRPCSNAKAPSPDSFVLKRMDSLAGARELFFSFLPPVDRWRRGVNNIWLQTITRAKFAFQFVIGWRAMTRLWHSLTMSVDLREESKMRLCIAFVFFSDTTC